MGSGLTGVAYAKNPEHERFLLEFKGECRGRYLSALLAGAGVLGGQELRQQIATALGRDHYELAAMYPARDVVVIFDALVRAGLSVARMGEVIVSAYKAAYPFTGTSVAEALARLEAVYRSDSTYARVVPAPTLQEDRARIFRNGTPVPCESFCGTVAAMLKGIVADIEVRESACQWEGAQYCRFDVSWRKISAS